VISGWQEAYLGDSKPSPVGVPINVSPAPVSRGDDVGGGNEGNSEGRAGAGGADAGEDNEDTSPGGGDRCWHCQASMADV
jgi:hypothetical protein